MLWGERQGPSCQSLELHESSPTLCLNSWWRTEPRTCAEGTFWALGHKGRGAGLEISASPGFLRPPGQPWPPIPSQTSPGSNAFFNTGPVVGPHPQLLLNPDSLEHSLGSGSSARKPHWRGLDRALLSFPSGPVVVKRGGGGPKGLGPSQPHLPDSRETLPLGFQVLWTILRSLRGGCQPEASHLRRDPLRHS